MSSRRKSPGSNLWSFNFLTFENRAAHKAAPIYFGLFIAFQLAVVLLFIRYFFRPTWDQQVAAGPVAIIAVTLAANMVMCFGEYFFHRYLLHMPMVKFLGSLCSSHLTHHKLTYIQFDDTSNRVKSAYAITGHEQDDQSTFPPWALLVFFGFWTPFFAVTAFSFPGFPILIGGYTALAIAHFLYETIHAVHHEDYDTYWAPRIARPVTGSMWHWLHGFHQAHHANYKCNMNVAGFFGIPVADIVLGTYKKPTPLLIHGAVAGKAAARDLVPQPWWPVSRLDQAAVKRRKRMKHGS